MTSYSSVRLGAARLRPGLYERRRILNRRYVASLTTPNLLQNFYLEAGIGDQAWHLRLANPTPGQDDGSERHWGWETPGGQLRGHFLGHWMSAAAREVAVNDDAALAAQLAEVVRELRRCQLDNDNGWVFAIPPTFLDRLAKGKQVWAPQYAMHKTLMGLVDTYLETGDELALEVAEGASEWIDRWSSEFSREEFDDILDMETGGMLEVWADLLHITGRPLYSQLLDRYWRERLFAPLVAGVDVLTNQHANTTIPEVLGAARAFEVTGDARWRAVVEAYWRSAVTDRGTFCTGGQTSGEIWTPPFEFAARRGEKTQEHCAVYNMIRLADVLFRWTGEVEYLDYIELNLVNGILAQQHPVTGMIAYFLPLEGGARKNWGSPRDDFWCCHGTLVQAHTRHSALPFYRGDDGSLVIAQYFAAELTDEHSGVTFRARIEPREQAQPVGPDANAGAAGLRHRPDSIGAVVTIESDADATLPLRLRVPSWVHGEATFTVTGDAAASETLSATGSDGFVDATHTGRRTVIELELPYQLRAVPIPDEPDTVAFIAGPTVLAGLVDHEVTLHVDDEDPTSILVPDNERQWSQWLPGYRTRGQDVGIRFLPVRDIADEAFSLYFPLKRTSP